MAKKWARLGAHWEMFAITIVLFVLVAAFVDLKPVVDENFFFSTSDPGLRQSKKLEQNFPSQPQVILAVSSKNISSPAYLGRIQKLTQEDRKSTRLNSSHSQISYAVFCLKKK